ncbi:hypothetical protein DYB36_006718 [Aphanomyces astaci]|uniref:Mitochondrial splicing suppressor 51-like C-terminal domain-containing protein n=1 Tax=Aphanomyces astaci TaxID=112090 RepID=A0A397A5L1_APHAT|nr:hypothetical protein DYB36_006718 [Aphanomyces astaci]
MTTASTWTTPPKDWTETPLTQTTLSDDLTNIHSRSFTVLKALERLHLLHPTPPQHKHKHKLPGHVDPHVQLVLHIVGADFREGNEVSETLRIFDQLVAAFQSQGQTNTWDELVLVFIGPNVARKLHGKNEQVSLLNGKSVRVQYVAELWDEYLRSRAYISPAVLFCFNAGVWGYDEWLPTFQRMVQEAPHAPIVVTSYNECEAIDDSDAIADVEVPITWHWTMEANPFASRSARASHHDRVLHENAYWQCFGAK